MKILTLITVLPLLVAANGKTDYNYAPATVADEQAIFQMWIAREPANIKKKQDDAREERYLGLLLELIDVITDQDDVAVGFVQREARQLNPFTSPRPTVITHLVLQDSAEGIPAPKLIEFTLKSLFEIRCGFQGCVIPLGVPVLCYSNLILSIEGLQPYLKDGTVHYIGPCLIIYRHGVKFDMQLVDSPHNYNLKTKYNYAPVKCIRRVEKKHHKAVRGLMLGTESRKLDEQYSLCAHYFQLYFACLAAEDSDGRLVAVIAFDKKSVDNKKRRSVHRIYSLHMWTAPGYCTLQETADILQRFLGELKDSKTMTEENACDTVTNYFVKNEELNELQAGDPRGRFIYWINKDNHLVMSREKRG